MMIYSTEIKFPEDKILLESKIKNIKFEKDKKTLNHSSNWFKGSRLRK